MDYTCWGTLLNNMNPWDFMSDVKKVKKNHKKKEMSRVDITMNEDDEGEEHDCSIQNIIDDKQSLEEVLNLETRVWPVAELELSHHDSETHVLIIWHPST